MRASALLVLLVPLGMAAQPGPYWALGFGGQADDRVTAITRGQDQWMYACGTFSGVFTYYGGVVVSQGVTDVFVMKLDTAGNVDWLRTAGGPALDRATDIAVDDNGDVVVTGQFSGTLLVEGVTLTSNGPSQDIFLAKWNEAGELAWARTAGSPENVDIGQQIAMDGAGNVYIAGEFSGTAYFGLLNVQSTYDPQLQELGSDVFVAKYSAAGVPQWVRKGAAIYADKALGLAADPDGNCYLAGQFSDVITFDVPHVNTLNNAGFLVKFNAAGAEQWFRRIGGGGSVLVGDLSHDDGTLWMVGSQSGNNLLFATPPVPIASAYDHSVFVLGFEPDGDLIMQRCLGSDHVINGACIDARAGQLAVGGTFICQALELSEESGGDGLFLSWGEANGWVALLRQEDLGMNYAQMLADNAPMDLRGLAFSTSNRIHAAGEFSGALVIPTQEGRLRAWPGDSIFMIGPNGLEGSCFDTTYYDCARLFSHGVLDGFITKGFIPERAPLDIFPRDSCEFSFKAVFDVIAVPPVPCNDDAFDAGFCAVGQLAGSFNYLFGPDYSAVWNTGTQGNGLLVDQNGVYTAEVDVGPGCFQSADSISVGICPAPWLPGISDDLGINVQDSLCLAIQVCDPQQVTLTAGPIPGVSFHWFHFPDTVITDTTFTSGIDGLWTLNVLNELGCSSSTDINLLYVSADTLGDVQIEQHIEFPQDVDGNDTITVCDYQSILVELFADVLMNGALMAPGFMVVDTVISDGAYLDISGFDLSEQPKLIMASYGADGWYIFEYHLDVSDLPCHDHHANAVFLDSIYVVGQGSNTGQVDILGSIFLCTGDTVTLTALTNGPGELEWSAVNGGIVGPNDQLSIQLVQPGLVTIAFSPQDTGACIMGDVDEHSVALVAPPVIDMDPVSGLVCPGDPVELIVSGVQGTYEWFGPGGPLPQTTSTISVSDAGTYFCVVDTYEGCTYATALATVSLFGTPFLTVFPQPVLCAGGSVEVVVQPTQNATYVWAAPLSGNTPYQTITAPGTYSCSVTQCGEVTDLSFTITQSTVNVGIVDDGPFEICPQDSVLLQATAGLVAYAWQPGNLVGQSVYAHEEGAYAVVGFDQYGCTDTAAAAIVDVYDFNVPLTAFIDTSCFGEPGQASATGSGTVNWYADPTVQQLLGTGASIWLGPFDSTTVIYVTLTDPQCVSDVFAVEAVVVPAGVATQILGDTSICIGGELSLQAGPGVDFSWNTPLGTFFGPNVVVPSIGPDAAGTWTVTASQSGCINGAATAEVIVADPQVGIVDTGPLILCPGDSVQLQATGGLVSYDWSPGGLSGQSVYTLLPGAFTVAAIDQYGCPTSAGTAVVNAFTFTGALTGQGTTVCTGQDALVSASGSGTITWYADSTLSQLLGSGPSQIVPAVGSPTTVYATQFEEPCTSAAVPVSIDLLPLPPAPEISGDNALCAGEQLLLNVSPVLPPTWTTPNGVINNWLVSIGSVSADDNGTYSVYYTENGCAGPSASVEVTVLQPPPAQLGPDQLICIGEVIVLDAGPGLSWFWSTGSFDQTISVDEAGLYWVLVSGASGCAGTDSINITQADCSIEIGNVFTPNDDGVNDVLTFTSPSSEPLEFLVHNRWGQLIYTQRSLIVQWDGHNGTDGSVMPEGVYYYVLRAVLPDGEVKDHNGYFHLIR